MFRKTVRSYLILPVILFLIISINSCTYNSIPLTIEEEPEGRRDYVWTIDTIDHPYVYLQSIWGDSDDDIWVVGESDEMKYRSFLYQGEKWIQPNTIWLYMKTVFGFNSRDVWAGGSGMMHFNGYSWGDWYTMKIDSFYKGGNVEIKEINGLRPDHVWAVGCANKNSQTYYGIIYHYDGQWKEQYIEKQNHTDFYHIYPTGEGDKCFVWGVKRNPNDAMDAWTTIYEYNGKDSLRELYTGYYNKDGCWVRKVGKDLYIIKERKIYRYNKGQLEFFLPYETIDYGNMLGGRNSKDIFVGIMGRLDHYNGTDVQTIFKMNSRFLIIDKVVALKDKIFFFAEDWDSNRFYLVKGELRTIRKAKP
ncbi:MAG: hypothetical protein ACM34K_10880 [Bacillota bacterium]